MQLDRDLANSSLEALQKAGADKAQCVLRVMDKSEFTVNSGKIDLLRTTENGSLTMTAIVDGQKGSLNLNELDAESVERAVADVIELARTSPPDEANDIAEGGAAQVFEAGPTEPDLDAMYDRLSNLIEYSKETHPRAIYDQMVYDFSVTTSLFKNSKGVDLQERSGGYSFSAMFSSREGQKSASFNYTGLYSHDANRELWQCGSLDRLLRENGEQVNTEGLKGKFIGDVIFTPDCLEEFLGTVTGFLGDGPMISGNSIYKDSIGQSIAAPSLTLHSRPISSELASGYHVTGDGTLAQDSTIIDKGVLTTHLLGLYGARKTGGRRAANDGGCFVVEPGDTPLDEMIAGVERGIWLGRFSGGHPTDSGDFSGVAKNSFLIENGRITKPLAETMLSGNIAKMLHTVRGFSRERTDFGNSIIPWMHAQGLTISGS
ncbi:MAG: TldD/PmbA family protein [Planctomycetes bacterium]|nr:TldD/PmbA family protein [Planctomycetota bacterium]